MTKVLITGAGALLGQEIFNSLKHSRLASDLTIGFADPSPYAVGFQWSDSAHSLPMASCDSYIDDLLHLITTHEYQFLIPGTDAELPKISRFQSHIESSTGCRVIISPPRVIEIANDKFLTASFLEKNGFAPPKSWSIETLGEENITLLPYPLIVKPRNGARSIGISKIDQPDQLMPAVLSSDNPVIQECIGSPDDEFTAGTFSYGNRCISTIILKRTLRDGNTWTAQVVNDEYLQSFIALISEKLQPYGPCNYQFRLDSSGMPRVFEINARFSGTTYMRTLSGFDEVTWALSYARDGSLPVNLPNSFDNLFFMRSLSVTSVPRSFLP